MSTAILIPARMESTRFPGKPLAWMQGRSLLQHAYRNAAKATKAQVVAVVTDSKEIVEHCREFDLFCVHDTGQYETGSDRCAGALKYPELHDGDLTTIVNLQCDEPEVTGEDLDALITLSVGTGHVATASCKMPAAEYDGHGIAGALKPHDPDSVVVAMQHSRRAAFFARYPLPGGELHVGVYVYPRGHLLGFASEPQPEIEWGPNLEQNRMIYMGTQIIVLQREGQRHSINTPEDIERWETNLRTLGTGRAK